MSNEKKKAKTQWMVVLWYMIYYEYYLNALQNLLKFSIASCEKTAFCMYGVLTRHGRTLITGTDMW